MKPVNDLELSNEFQNYVELFQDLKAFGLSQEKALITLIENAYIDGFIDGLIDRTKAIPYENHPDGDYNIKFAATTFRPTSSAFSYIGMSLEEANKKSDGWFFNVSNDNGKLLPISAALCSNRICVKIEDNKITGIESVGI